MIMSPCDNLMILLNDKELKIKDLKKKLKDCRNELCLMCGKYERAHKGACNGCRWDRMEEENV